jgi:hypothetical protein
LVGEVKYKDEILLGEQPAIMDRALFDAVQQKLTDQWTMPATPRAQTAPSAPAHTSDCAPMPSAPRHGAMTRRARQPGKPTSRSAINWRDPTACCVRRRESIRKCMPDAGNTPAIPPPGSPGGDPNIRPK